MLIMNFRNTLLALFLSMVFALPVHSVAVDKPLGDPMLEARARAIHKQLRCLVCQNQSIEDSNASLARDLRILVRDRISAGDDDEAVIRFVVDRYGDWVLLQPPLTQGSPCKLEHPFSRESPWQMHHWSATTANSTL